MAFKLRSPLHDDDKPDKYALGAVPQKDPNERFTGSSLGTKLSQVNADDVPTPGADPDTENTETSYDKLKAKVDTKGDTPVGGDKNTFIKERIALSTNPAQTARLKGRLAVREEKQAAKHERQTDRARAINYRNFGNEQGLSEMEIADKEAASFDKEWNMIEQGNELQRKIDNDPDLQEEDAVVIENLNETSPGKMTVNRAGRSKESGALMTNPVIKTGKHSNKDAVAKIKLQNIAQTPLFQSIQYSEPPTAAEEKARAAGFKKTHPELYTKEAMAKDKAQGRDEAERKAYNSEGMESELSFED